MLKYYLNKDLSQKLSVPLAKWKRWSREFLPPDPLGGYRSGYARQYSLREAFRVYLGGHLVSDLRFTIPEARTILDNLDSWIGRHIIPRGGFPASGDADRKGPPPYEIHIWTVGPDGDGGRFRYVVREMESVKSTVENGDRRVEERYQMTVIGRESDTEGDQPPVCRVLLISRAASWFADRMGLLKS